MKTPNTKATKAQSECNLAAAKNLACFIYGSVGRAGKTRNDFWDSLPKEVKADCLDFVEKRPPPVRQPTYEENRTQP